MEVASLIATIGADTTGLTAQLGAAEGVLRRFAGTVETQAGRAASAFASGLDRMESAGQSLASLGGTLTAGLTVPLAGLGIASVKAAGDIQALEKGFAATYRGSEPLQDALAKVRELAKLPGLGLKEALQGATNLQAAGFSADLARRSLQAFGNALATVGRGKADLEGVQLALGQIASKGKISAEEINQLAERVPQIRSAMQAAFGTSDTEVLQKAKISATQFVEGVTAELAKLPAVTGGINNAFENFTDSLSKSAASVGAVLNNRLGIEGALGQVGAFVEGLADRFSNLSPELQDTILSLGGLALAVGPVLGAIGAIGAAIPALVTGLGTVGAAVGLAAGPFALLVVGVGAAAVGIVTHWDNIVGYFNGPDGAIFGEVYNSAKVALDKLAPLVEAVGKAITFQWSASLAVLGTLGKGAFEGLGETTKAGLDLVTDTFRAFKGLFTGDVTAFLANIRNVWADGFLALTGPVRGLGDAASRGLADLAQKAGLDEFAATMRTGADRAKELADGLRAETLDGNTGISPYFAGLNSGLAGFVQLAPGAVAAASAVNKAGGNVVDPQAAKRLEEMRKALGKFRESLQDVGTLSNALGRDEGLTAIGSQYDYVENRAKALESGIVSLVRAGFGAQSAVVQNAVGELQRLKNAYDDLGRIDLKLPAGVSAPKAPEVPTQAFATGTTALPTTLPLLNIEPFTGPLAEASERLAQFQLAGEQFTEGFNNIVVAGLQDAAVGFGEAIGQIVSGAAGIEALPGVVLGALGTMAVQVGQLAIGTGLAVLGIKKALESLNPAVAIAGGIALVALGSVVKGAASRIAKGGGGGASLPGGGGSTPAASVSPNPTAQPQRIQLDLRIEPVELRQKGPDMAAVLRYDEYRTRRVG